MFNTEAEAWDSGVMHQLVSHSFSAMYYISIEEELQCV
jgi:hypothetical protein